VLLVTRFAGGPRLQRSNSAYSPQQEPLKRRWEILSTTEVLVQVRVSDPIQFRTRPLVPPLEKGG